MWAYIEGVQNFNLGLANALAVVMFVFLAFGGIAYFKAFNPSSEVET